MLNTLPPASPPSFDVRLCDDHCTVGRLGGVLGIVVRKETRSDAMHISRQLCQELAREGKPFLIVIVVGPEAAMPSGAPSQAIRDMSKEFGEQIQGTLLVLQGNALWRSSMRVVARTMMMAVGNRYPFHLAESFEQAAPWLRDRCRLDARSMQRALSGCMDADECCKLVE